MTFWDTIAQVYGTVVGRQRTTSALTSMLWLCAVVLPISLYAAYKFSGNPIIQGALVVVLAIVPVTITCWGFCYFARTNPGRLQSEEFQLKQQSLHIVEKKAHGAPIDPALIREIIVGGSRRLPKGEDRGP